MAETAASYKFQKLTQQILEDIPSPTLGDVEAAREYVDQILDHDRLLLVDPLPKILARLAAIKAAAARYEDDFYARHKIYLNITRWRRSPMPSCRISVLV